MTRKSYRVHPNNPFSTIATDEESKPTPPLPEDQVMPSQGSEISSTLSQDPDGIDEIKKRSSKRGSDAWPREAGVFKNWQPPNYWATNSRKL